MMTDSVYFKAASREKGPSNFPSNHFLCVCSWAKVSLWPIACARLLEPLQFAYVIKAIFHDAVQF